MKPEAQRIAIAEACGFARAMTGSRIYLGRSYFEESLPNYLNDLNAMHEAEKVLNLAQFWTYADLLREHHNGLGVDGYITASAAQRAKAFLRTLGKWEDDK